MSGYTKALFTTGEFAKLCGTTKDTLFYYDRIGLLKPKFVEENGYRKYTSEQFFDFDMIRVLGKAGSTLKEIKWYQEHYDTQHFLILLEEKEEQLRKQKEELERTDHMLSHVIAMTRQAIEETYGVPRVEWQEEETLLTVRLNDGEVEDEDSSAIRFGEHFARCEQYGLADKFPIGSIMLQEDLESGHEEERFFFSKVPDSFEGEGILKKPAGFYGVIIHYGEYDTSYDSYKKLLDYIKNEKKLEICGNAYAYELVGYLAAGDENRYVIKISIQVSGNIDNA